MKEDIEIPKVEGISVAVVKEMNEEKTAEVFNVYLLNLRDTPISNVLVSSSGYGTNVETGEDIKTSQLRHFIGDMEEKSYAKIEPIVEQLFGLNNQYWVSFYSGGKIHDKKFIFLAETITPENFREIPLLDKKGVLI